MFTGNSDNMLVQEEMTIPDCQDWFGPMLTHKLRNVLIVPQAGIRLLILLYLPKVFR